MGKFFFEHILLQKFLDPISQTRMSQNLVNCRSSVHINGQELTYQISQISWIMSRNRFEFTSYDMHSEEVHVHTLERWLQSAHFIEQNSDGPDISLEGIGSTFNNLGWQVIRGTHHWLAHLHRMLKHPGDSKVTNLDDTLFCQENVLAFDISVQNFTVMDVLHSEAYLGKPVKNGALWKVAASLLLNLNSQITSIGIVHDNTQMSFLRLVRFAEFDDVWVVEDL